MRSWSWLVMLLMPLAPAAAAAALEAQAVVAPGLRLRARSGPTPVVGTVVSLSETSLLLRRDSLGDTLELPLGSLSDVQVSEASPWSARGLKFGWVAGAGLGYGIARVAGVGSEKAAGVPAVIGAVAGALAGVHRKADHWVAASIVVPAPHAPVATRLAVVAPDSGRPAGAPDSGAAPAAAGRAVGPERGAPAVAESPNLRKLRSHPGERIRYESDTPGVKQIARVLRVEGDTVVLLLDTLLASPVRVDARSLRALEFSQGWSRRGNRTGAAIGMLVGAGAAYLAYQPNAGGDYFGLGAMIFGGLGVGLGGLLGSVVGDTGKRERWASDPPPVAEAHPRTPRLGLRLVLRP